MLLPDEEGKYYAVTDFRHTEATVSNGKAPNYFCARYTTNGHHIVQRCNSPTRSGETRRMMQEMVDYLKRGHWIDHQTRMVVIQMQTRSNNAQVRFLTRIMFELNSMGSILSSYDAESMVG